MPLHRSHAIRSVRRVPLTLDLEIPGHRQGIVALARDRMCDYDRSGDLLAFAK